MRRILIPSVGLAMFCAMSSSAQVKAMIQNVPEIPLTSVPTFVKTPASDILGQSVGPATNSKGHVFVFHRSANTRLCEYDANGNFLKEMGVGYCRFEFAHSVRVDKNDDIWTVDEGANMVTKFSPDGRVLVVIGSKPPTVAGASAYPVGRPERHSLPPRGCRLGPAGEYLCLRRLRQQPTREVRQEWSLHVRHSWHHNVDIDKQAPDAYRLESVE